MRLRLLLSLDHVLHSFEESARRRSVAADLSEFLNLRFLGAASDKMRPIRFMKVLGLISLVTRICYILVTAHSDAVEGRIGRRESLVVFLLVQRWVRHAFKDA